jgi:hypothetical protein
MNRSQLKQMAELQEWTTDILPYHDFVLHCNTLNMV